MAKDDRDPRPRNRSATARQLSYRSRRIAAQNVHQVDVDVLTTAPGGWALCVFVVTLASSSVLTGRRLVIAASVSSLSWIAGYAWTRPAERC